MTTIKDILTLDLQEDIKNVIDLEDRSEDEIQSEIESYIVTDGLGEHLSKFISLYTGNIKETGVWLSGFYGSGKSYFGKMLGYLIDNPIINGTPARDRFIPRLAGVANQSLIENDIRKLDSVNSLVIFLDIAKQNTDNGMAFTLFSNFLKTLGFRDDVLGYYSYHLFIKGKYDEFVHYAEDLFGDDWAADEENFMESIYKVNAEKYGKSEEVTSKTIDLYNNNIQSFSPVKLKDELEKYLQKFRDERIVFVFDETSEAISQKKINLLELEGISESLSSISNKVWTIAIAQEKLDDVINNTNVNRARLNKVTDRFKTKIHLESTEVDIIIRNRLLSKKENAFNELVKYYKKHDGLINDATNLKSSFPTKTTSAEQFATYYPFHKYQFDLLQKFLFSSNALVATQIAARGMIITTFDVLRKELRNRELYNFTTAHDLCSEAQTAPPAVLVNKYDTSKRIVANADLDINGENLLKAIHFINESELIFPTIENITKTYIDNLEDYYKVKPSIEKALALLIEAKILLYSNNNYKITSDLEGKLLEEMNDFDVELFIKKRELVNYLKKTSLFRQVSVINEDAVPYNFNVLTDLDDEIIPSKNKNLRITVYSLFNINKDRQDFIEGLKMDTQYNKGLITLVPDNKQFTKIDRLLEEVKRYSYMEEKYSNDDDPDKRQIIREFSTMKDEKEKDLIHLIEEAYVNGSLLYMFDENLLNRDHFKGVISEIQRKLIKNIYTKRLPVQLSEEVGRKILNESNAEKLHRYFSGDDFKFFDAKGNFVGDHLKVVEEITSKFNNHFVDGRSLEDALSLAPWGYTYGTISTTLAVLFRAGRLIVKYNDTEYFTYSVKPAHEVFASGTRFKTARFKPITKTLSASEKNQVVQTLLDLEYEKYTQKKLGWNVSDFETSDAITRLAEYFITSVKTLKSTQPEFNKFFGNVNSRMDVLQNFSAKTTEANYIEKAQDFIRRKDEYIEAVKTIIKAEKFIKKNLDKIKGFKRFVKAVNNELQKAGLSNKKVQEQTLLFDEAMANDVIAKFADIQKTAQAIKDEYYELMSSNVQIMEKAYSALKQDVLKAKDVLETKYPPELNKRNLHDLGKLLDYCTPKIIKGIKLEYQIECQNSGFSLSDILNYIALAPSKEAELEMIKNNFVSEESAPANPDLPKPPRKLQLRIPARVMTVSEYKRILAAQLQAMAGMPNNDQVEVNLNND